MKLPPKKTWDTAKAGLRGALLAIHVYIKKEERYWINNLTFHPKSLEKEEQSKSKASRRKDIIKIRVEINELENWKAVETIKETGSLKKVNKIGKPLARLT